MNLESIKNYLSNPDTKIMIDNSIDMFITLFLELTFLFIAISYLVAVINQKLSAERIQSLLGAKKGRGYLTAAGLGAVTPFCSCSTIPMLIGLLKAKAGFGPIMTFLFTSPLLNPIVIALFIPVLGLEATILYATLAIAVSLSAGILLQRFGFDIYIKKDMLEPQTTCTDSSCSSAETSSCCDDNSSTQKSTSCCDSGNNPKQESSCCSTETPKETSLWIKAWFESWALFKTMLPYMFIAMVIGALVHGFVPADFFTQVASSDNPAAVPAAAIIGIPLYIRVTTLLPLVASFLAKGVSIGAVIALVIGSGGASLPEVILLKKLFKWPLLLAFLGVIFSMAVIGGYLFNFLLG